MRFTVIFFLFCLPLPLCAQFTYVLDQTVAVKNTDGNALSLPWAGGLNATQYNTLDLNNDGANDLVLFDRMANKVLTFLREGADFKYDPAYENYFPSDILNWVLLRDYNCDGRKDLFTGDNLGIKVYTNTTVDGQPPSFSQFFFYTGFPGTTKSSVLLSKGFSNKVNVQIQFDDLPSISDVDGDGDLDLLNMRYVGNGNVEFHKNLSMERYGTCDSLDFERITQTWGNFRECTCGVFAFNGEDCPTSGGRTKHAGGKSLLALDLNGDQQEELLFSEATCSQLFRLTNQGTTDAPIVQSSNAFPISEPAVIIVFPTPYYEDIDGDGKNDLMVSSNSFVRDYSNSDYKNSNWFYQNTGTNATPIFNLVQKNFLQDKMIDLGDNAVPAFIDADGDEDYDMFISSHSLSNFRSPVLYYENTGTAQSPEFTLRDEDYLTLSLFGDFNRKIQFADVDGNNTMDFVFTSTRYNDGITRLFYISNKSQGGLDFSNQSVVEIPFGLTRTENVYFFDLDEDGKVDILAGRSEGSLEFWKQNGDLTFTLSDQDFAGLGSSVLRQNISPFIADMDGDGTLDLLYGDQSGVVRIIPDYKNAVDVEVTDIIFNSLADEYQPLNLGGKIWPVVVNLFGSTKPAIIAGNTLGGIHILKHDEGESLPGSAEIDIYPNPVDQSQTLTIKIDRPATLEIYSSIGKRIGNAVRLQPFARFERSVAEIPSGLYIFKFSNGKKSFSRKVVIDR